MRSDRLKKVGETKILILRSCVKPKRWTELVKLTARSEPTMKVHLDDLYKMELLDKKNGKYQTTEKGINHLHLIPHFRERAPKGKISSEVLDMAHLGIMPGFSLKEKLEVYFAPGIFLESEKNELRQFYENIARAMRDSVTVWLPKDVKPDKDLNEAVNKIIASHIKLASSKVQKGKFRIMIDFDLPLALDYAIREDKNEYIKKRLIDNREKILEELYDNWMKIVS